MHGTHEADSGQSPGSPDSPASMGLSCERLASLGISPWAVFVPIAIATLMALAFVAVYVYIALVRISYPFELEWMEGGSVDHVRRILDGQALYSRPSIEFVTYIYPPLYFYVSALVSKVTGMGFMPLRLVSFVSSLGSFALIFLFIYRETRNRIAALLGMGLFAATFELGGAWFDIARVDSLSLFLLLAGAYLVRSGSSPTAYVLAGMVLSLSHFTKQSALLVALPLAAYSLVLGWRRGLFLAATLVILIAGGTLFLNAVYDGWYNYYVHELPQQHEIVKEMLLGFWAHDLLRPMPVAIAIALSYFAVQRATSDKKGLVFYTLLVAGLTGGAWLSRLHSGGWLNVLVPAYAGISLLFGLAIGMLWKQLKIAPSSMGRLGITLIGIAATVQFAGLIYAPAKYVPDKADKEAGDQFIAMLASIEGDVFVPNHGFLSSLAGKKAYAQSMAVSDVLRGDDNAIKAVLMSEVRQAIQRRQFSAIVLDGHLLDYFHFVDDIEQSYQLQGPVFPDNTVFWPVTGLETRPEEVYVPRTP